MLEVGILRKSFSSSLFLICRGFAGFMKQYVFQSWSVKQLSKNSKEKNQVSLLSTITLNFTC